MSAEFQTYLWQFFLEYRSLEEQSDQVRPYEAALAFAERQAANYSQPLVVIGQILKECETAANGDYASIRSNDSLIEQLRLATEQIRDERFTKH